MQLLITFFLFLLNLPLFAGPVPPALPAGSGSWGDYVYIYTQATQGTLDADAAEVYNSNKQLIPNGTYLNQGYAFLLAPGTYTNKQIKLGYYTSIMGLSTRSSSTIIDHVDCIEESSTFCVGSLNNFWRSAENFLTNAAQERFDGSTGMTWAGKVVFDGSG